MTKPLSIKITTVVMKILSKATPECENCMLTYCLNGHWSGVDTSKLRARCLGWICTAVLCHYNKNTGYFKKKNATKANSFTTFGVKSSTTIEVLKAGGKIGLKVLPKQKMH